MAATSGGCWPTDEQTLLLRAALLTGPPAIAAYQAWRGRVTLDGLDRGSYRLLPLLAHNLKRHEIRDPAHARLEEVSRETQVRNGVLMARLQTLLAAFSQAGLETMILKGSALLVLYYSDPGLRPMSDLDLLVRTEKVGRAIDLLRESGWMPQLETPERVVSVAHSTLFQDSERIRLDLHWHVLWECCGPGVDDDFWEMATTTAVAGVPTMALCPEDQLLHACAHGLAWNPVPPLRWVADAMLILRAAPPSFAWDRLLIQARRLQLDLLLRRALTFLRNALEAPVPDSALAALRSPPTSMFERLEYRARVRPWGRFGALPRLLCHYLRVSRATGHPRGVLGFPRYLHRVYGLRRIRDLPPELWRRFRQEPDARRPGRGA